jgi:hypothetical protein
LRKFTYLWDVLFTYIDTKQAQLWYKLEEKRVDMYFEIDYLKKNKDLEDYDSFEEVK